MRRCDSQKITTPPFIPRAPLPSLSRISGSRAAHVVQEEGRAVAARHGRQPEMRLPDLIFFLSFFLSRSAFVCMCILLSLLFFFLFFLFRQRGQDRGSPAACQKTSLAGGGATSSGGESSVVMLLHEPSRAPHCQAASEPKPNKGKEKGTWRYFPCPESQGPNGGSGYLAFVFLFLPATISSLDASDRRCHDVCSAP